MAAWTVRAKIAEHGWSAEFAIPFRTLRYPSRTAQTWGINFQRNIRRRNERAYWAPIPRQFNLYRLSLAGSIGGVQTPALRNFRITPYGLGNVLASGRTPVDAETDFDFGGDLKYSITPSLTLDATVNTDFAQVEVDDQQVNLDRFTLFFPEKRPFFLENAGFFSVGNPGEVDLFFSRRIGIGDNGAGDPDHGRRPRLGQGRQVQRRPAEHADLRLQRHRRQHQLQRRARQPRPAEPLVDRRDLHQPRRPPAISPATTSTAAPSASTARSASARRRWCRGSLAKTETPGVDESDHAFNIRSQTNRPQWDLNVGYQEVGSGFNPEIGFLSRRGYRKPDASLMTRFRPKDFINIQELRPHATFRGFWGLDGFQETGFMHLDNHWQFRDSTEIHTGMNLTREGVRTPFEIYPGIFVPPGTYDHAEAQLVAMSNQGAPFSVSMRATIGGFFGGDRLTLNPTLRMRAGDALTAQIDYQRNDINLPWGAVRHQPGSHARLVFVHVADVHAGAHPVQRSRRPVVDELPVRLAPGRQHRPVRRLYRHARPLRSVRAAGAHRSIVDRQVLVHVRLVPIGNRKRDRLERPINKACPSAMKPPCRASSARCRGPSRVRCRSSRCVAWVATMGVMINRSYLQASSRNLATDLARYGSTAQWRGVYYRGEKIGFTVSQVQPTDDGFELQEDGRLQLSLLGAHDRRDPEDHRAGRSRVRAPVVRLLARPRHRPDDDQGPARRADAVARDRQRRRARAPRRAS